MANNTMQYRGLTIHIENAAGTTRSGVDKKTGKKWSTTMTHDYGEIVGSVGVDGDPVDCFIGPNHSAAFVYVMHQTKKDGSGFDEDKCMLGFDDIMHAKQAYIKNFDLPNHFIGSIEAIPFASFKEKVMSSKDMPGFIHAKMTKTDAIIQLYAAATRINPLKKGDQVTVDGMHGRGVVQDIDGERVAIRFRSGEYLTRDFIFVHKITSDYKNPYMTGST